MEHKNLNSKSNSSGISAAERLRTFKEDILQSWMDRVCEVVPAAKAQTCGQLRDDLPKFLDKLADSLSELDIRNEVDEACKDHGEQRSSLEGYSLSQILKEYQVLREIIFNTLERQSPVTTTERDIILGSIELGMTEASREFERLSLREDATSRMIIDGIRDHAIIRSDRNGKILDWNSGAEKLFGWHKDELIGKDAGTIFTPEDLAKDAPRKEMITAAGEGKAEDKRWHVRKDGSRFFANGIMNPLVDRDGNVEGFIKVLRDDTERARMEEERKIARKALEVEKENIQRLFELSTGFVAIWEGPDFVYRYVNPAHDKIHGRHVTGEKLLDVLPAVEESGLFKLLNEVMTTGNLETIKELPLTMAGETRYFDANYIPWKNDKGEIDGVVSWGNEVTDQVLATQKIKESENKFRSLMETVPHIVWFIDDNGAFRFISRQFSNYTGLGEELIDGRIWEKIVHPDDVQTINDALREAKKNKGPFTCLHRIKRSDGEYRWNFGLSNPVFNEDKELTGWIGTTTDIHEQKVAEDTIKQNEEKFRTLANTLPQIIWTATPDGYVDWYNDWWFDYLGQSRGTKWDDPEKQPMHPDDIPRTLEIWGESLKTGKLYQMEQRFKRGVDGEYRWHLVRGSPIKDKNGKIIKWVGANTDIHDHKILVQKLEEERELRERFVAALSHDLRTPLTSAKLSAQVMKRSYSKDDNILRVSDRIVGNLDRVDSMIQDLLDASRLSGGEKLPIKREESELSAIVHSTVEELRHLHGNRFEVIEEAEFIQGSWDAGGIRRILENLCNNAVKYGAPDSPITIRVGCDIEHMAHLIVHNSGRPIPANDIKNLFVLYKRSAEALTSDKKGWGIGLMLVKGVVDAHGGTIEVTSTESEGTNFIVKLPVKASSCS